MVLVTPVVDASPVAGAHVHELQVKLPVVAFAILTGIEVSAGYRQLLNVSMVGNGIGELTAGIPATYSIGSGNALSMVE